MAETRIVFLSLCLNIFASNKNRTETSKRCKWSGHSGPQLMWPEYFWVVKLGLACLRQRSFDVCQQQHSGKGYVNHIVINFSQTSSRISFISFHIDCYGLFYLNADFPNTVLKLHTFIHSVLVVPLNAFVYRAFQSLWTIQWHFDIIATKK